MRWKCWWLVMRLRKYEQRSTPRKRSVRSDAKYRNSFVVERSNGKLKWLFSYRAKTVVEASDWIRIHKRDGWYYQIVKERFDVDSFKRLRRTRIKHILLGRLKVAYRKRRKRYQRVEKKWNPHRWDVMYRHKGGEWSRLSTFKVKSNAERRRDELTESWVGVEVRVRYKRVNKDGIAYKIQCGWETEV